MGTSNSTNSYLTPPTLHGKMNSDGTYTLSALDIKALNDFNYRVASMIQGELNLANLNKATNDVFTGMVTFVDLSDPTKSTVINGDHITTGTISADRVNGGTLQGVKVISLNPTYGDAVELENGAIVLKNGTDVFAEIAASSLGAFIEAGTGKWLYLTGNVQVGMYNEVGVNGSVIKITSSGNMSIDSTGTTYIGASSVGETIDIGSATATINLNGTVYHNGVLL